MFNLRNSIVTDGFGDNFRPIQALNNRCITTNIASNNPTDESNNIDNKFESKLNEEISTGQTMDQMSNTTSNQDRDDLSGLKKFCTTNNVYGYYSYKGKD